MTRRKLLAAVAGWWLAASGCAARRDTRLPTPHPVPLPRPRPTGALSLESALALRRSVRSYASRPLTQQEIGQLLWAAQGVTSPAGFRTSPSAGALYPLEIYVALATGLFHYRPHGHQLQQVSRADVRGELAVAGYGQEALRAAPAVFAFTAMAGRTAAKYGGRAERYAHLEAGHAAQNLLLEAVALRLGAVPIGAFDDQAVRRVLRLAATATPLYLVPVGEPR